MKIEEYKEKLEKLNKRIDNYKSEIIQRKTKRDSYIQQLKEEFDIDDIKKIDSKLEELRKLHIDTKTQLDNVLEQINSNLDKVEKKLNEQILQT